jgi:hypothetical protein
MSDEEEYSNLYNECDKKLRDNYFSPLENDDSNGDKKSKNE